MMSQVGEYLVNIFYFIKNQYSILKLLQLTIGFSFWAKSERFVSLNYQFSLHKPPTPTPSQFIHVSKTFFCHICFGKCNLSMA